MSSPRSREPCAGELRCDLARPRLGRAPAWRRSARTWSSAWRAPASVCSAQPPERPASRPSRSTPAWCAQRWPSSASVAPQLGAPRRGLRRQRDRRAQPARGRRPAPAAHVLCVSSAEVYGEPGARRLCRWPRSSRRSRSPPTGRARRRWRCSAAPYARGRGLRIAIDPAFNQLGPGQSPDFAASGFARQHRRRRAAAGADRRSSWRSATSPPPATSPTSATRRARFVALSRREARPAPTTSARAGR